MLNAKTCVMKYANILLLIPIAMLVGLADMAAQNTNVQLKVLRYWSRHMGDGNNPPDPEWKTTASFSNGITANGLHYDWYDNFLTALPNCAGLEVYYSFLNFCAPREKVYSNQNVVSFNGAPSSFSLTNSFRVTVRLDAWEEDGPSGQMDGSGGDDEISNGQTNFLVNIPSDATFPYTHNFSVTTANNSFRADYQLVVTQIDAFSNTKLRYANSSGATQTSFCAGSTVRLYVDRNPGYTNGWFEWQRKVNGNWVSATSTQYSSNNYLELPATSPMPEVRVRSANTGTGGIGASDGWIDNVGQAITVVPAPPAASDIITTATGACSGSSNGAIAVSIDGSPSGTYALTLLNSSNVVVSNLSLSGAPYNTSFTGLAAGTYRIRVTRSGSNLDCTTEKSNIVVSSLSLPTLTAAPAAANCFGGNGSITVAMTQSSGNNVFRIFNAAGTAELASFTTTAAAHTFSLAAGTYRARVTNGSGCQSELSGNIVIPAAPTAIAANISTDNINGTGYQIACRGGQGEIRVTPAGGTPPYRIEINGSTVANNVQSGATTPFNRPAGAYAIGVFDSRNCALAAPANIVLSEPPTDLAVSVTDLADASDCAPTGSARLVGAGGATPYQYSLSPSGPFSTNAIFSNLAAGPHTGYVRAATGCTASVPFTIGAPNPLLVQAIAISDVACAGQANGSVTVDATGGMPPYQYRMGNGVFSPQNVFTGLSADTYTFEVQDASFCTNTILINVAAPGAIVITDHTAGNLNCENTARDVSLSFTGRADGLLNFFDNGLEISIDNGQTFSPFAEDYDDGIIVRTGLPSLPIGNHNIIIRDAANCLSNTYSLDVTFQPPLFVSVDATTDETCAGANDGSITVSFGGGVGPYYLRLVLPFSSDELSVIQEFGPTEAGVHTFTNVPVHVGGYAGYFVEIRDGYGGDLWNFRCSESDPPIPPGPLPQGIGTFIYPSTPFNPGTPVSTGPNINCYGNNGQLTITGASGGMPPYQYSLDGLEYQSGNVFSGLGEQNEVYVRDDRNCVVGPIAANIPAAPVTLAAAVSVTAPQTSCSQGSMRINISGGTAPFEVILLTASDCELEYEQATSYNTSVIDIADLAAGDYTVCIRDAGGCRADQIVSIPEVDAPTMATASVQNTTCFNGGNNGAITLQLSGGTPPYEVVMNNDVAQTGGAGNMVFTGLEAGYYLFELTDDNGCTTILQEQVQSNSTVYADIYITEITGCAGDNTGILEFIPSNGVAPYTVTWLWDNTVVSGVAEGQSLIRNNLPAGLYEVMVIDAAGCERTESEVIDSPLPISANLIVNDALCANVLNGSVQVNAIGGANPFEYALDGGLYQPGNTFSGLAPGDYTVTVRDAGNCTADFNFTIGLQRIIMANATPADPGCFGQNTGSIAIAAVGGGVPYTYSVNGGAFSSANPITGLGAGTYDVVVRDNGGCEFSINDIQLNQPVQLMATATLLQDASCANNAGNLLASATGGTPGYTYQWDGNPALNAAAYNNAPPGPHTVVVTDTQGCTAQAMVSVSNVPTVTLNLVGTTNELCGQANGTATVAPQGGTAPFNYTWSHNAGLNSPVATSLTAGPYTVTVTDANNCSAIRSLTVAETATVTLSFTEVKNTFCQEGNGRIIVSPSGGLAPLTYTWSHAPGLNSPIADNLNSGNYSVTVTDANNCSFDLSAGISLVLGPTASATAAATACQGNTGSISVAVQGGMAPFSYTWSHNAGLNTNIATGLATGTYSCTVSDINGCTAIVSATVSELPPPQVSISANTARCSLPNGSAQATVMGGTAPYTYIWSSGSPNSPLAQNLPGGSYSLTVSDVFGCQVVQAFTVGNIPGPTDMDVVVENSICQNFNGAITVSPQGGTPPYQYNWSHNAFLNAPEATLLAAGAYSVTATDANGCSITATRTVVLEAPPGIQTLQQVNSLCANGQGVIEILATGSAPFTYIWTNGVSTGPLAQNLNAGTYTVTVADVNGCNTTRTFSIALQPGPIVLPIAQVNDVCGQGLGSIRVRTVNGQAPITFSWSHNPGLNSDFPTGLTAGTYTVTATDANGCEATTQYTLTETPGPELSLVGVSTAFCGNPTGSATVQPVGGTGPYAFSWSHNAALNSSIAANLLPGMYTATVTDANGCTATIEAIVEGTDAPTLFLVNQTEDPCLAFDGSIQMGIDGAFPPFTYAWSHNPGLNSLTASNLGSGVYAITATDANGCSSSLSATVVDQQGPVLQVAGLSPSTCGFSDGLAALSVEQGLAPYTYTWSHNAGLNSPTADNLPAGAYAATVTDANGCTDEVNLSVSDSQGPQVVVSNATDAICDPQTGSIAVTVSGGFPPYAYSWSHNNGLNQPSAGGLSTGNYFVTITDAAGCQAVTSAGIGFQAPPAVAVNTVSALCDPATGAIDLVVSQGLPPYNILWDSPLFSGFSPAPVPAGDYTAIVSDANGCTTDVQLTVDWIAPPDLVLIAQQDPACGQSNGGLDVDAVGGQAPYSFTWSHNAGLNTGLAANLNAGSYTVTVADGNGCSTSQSFTLNDLPGVALTVVTANSVCAQSTGSATVTPAGGAAPLTYTWSHNAALNSPVAANLPAGLYGVTVTDANGCSAVAAAEVEDEGGVSASIGSFAHALCAPNTGSITVSTADGQAPFAYDWSHNGSLNSPNATGLGAGVYSVTVTDANGCQDIVSQTLSFTAGPDLALQSSVASLCEEGNGALVFAASGGSGTLVYEWSHNAGLNAPAAGALNSGVYSLTATDANGCTAIESAQVDFTPGPQPAIANQIAAYCGQNNGQIELAVAGGTAPLQYFWSHDANLNSASASALSAGGYGITVTDANNCVATLVATIADEPGFELSAPIVQQAACGNNSGQIQLSVNGGQLPLQYQWSHDLSLNSPTATDLVADVYTVTIVDAGGCVQQQSIAVQNTDGPALSIAQAVDASCGANNGSIATSIAGGQSPFNYLWSNGLTGSAISGLGGGSYEVTVTDAAGCEGVAVAVLEAGSAPVAEVIATENTACAFPSGLIQLSASGGAFPYTYQWSHDLNLDEPFANDLAAGSYAVTLTDAAGCTAQIQAEIEQETDLDLTLLQTQSALCASATGSAAIVASGGEGAYSYQWSHDPGLNAASATGLAAGSYTATVADAAGCTAELTFDLAAQNIPIALSISASTVSACNAPTGALSLTASGGQQPYTYAWSHDPMLTIGNAASLAAGSYTATVTDANGCTGLLSAMVEQTPAPELSLTDVVDSECNQATGVITISAAGGGGLYTYAWSHAPGLNAATATDLAAGSYIVTVTDANGCTASLSANISEVGAPDAMVSTTASYCDQPGGSASVQVSGDYAYTWENQSQPGVVISTEATADGLAEGVYQVTVTDGAGCSAVRTAIVQDLPDMLLSAAGAPASCADTPDGLASATVLSGGTGPFTFLWDAGQSGDLISGLAAGSYTVTATDANGCTATATAVVTAPPALAVSLTSLTQPLCNSTANGSISVQATGGAGSYAYLWSGGQQSASIESLSEGSYELTVTDANGCTAIFQTSLSAVNALSVSVITDAPACVGQNSGQAVATAAGDGPFTFQWNAPGNPAGNTAAGLAPGDYSVTVSNGAGCTAVQSFSIPAANAIGLTAEATPSCLNTLNGTATATAAGGAGGFTYQWSNLQSGAVVSNLAPGLYTVTATDANGCTAIESVAVLGAPFPTLTIDHIVQPDCLDQPAGSAQASASGGTGLIGYTWSDPGQQTTATATGLQPGVYEVTATDENGCSATAAIEIIAPADFVATVTDVDDPACFGQANGSATIAVQGGSGSFTIVWDDPASQTGPQASGLSAGSYTATVTDNESGCNATVSVDIEAPPALEITNLGATPVLCSGQNNGTASVAAAGGAGGYTYLWDDPLAQITPTATGLAAGIYTVVVTDANGCTAELPATVDDAIALNAAITAANAPLCFGDNSGAATVAATGGAGSYTYLWNDPALQTTAEAVNLPPGSYTVTITDANGCTATATAAIAPAQAIVVSAVDQIDPSCTGLANGSITVTATGGAGALIYAWSNGQSGPAISNLTAGDYTVSVSDANGCIVSLSMSLEEAEALVLASANVTPATCYSGADGSIAIDVQGGEAPYTYNWNDPAGQTSATASGLARGDYAVMVTDANGCTFTADFTVISAGQQIFVNPAISNASCEGATNATITLTAGGGSGGGFTYLWAGGQSGATLSNLSAGLYAATVTDGSGCTESIEVAVTEGEPFLADIGPADTLLCAGELLYVDFSGANYDVQWTSAGGFVSLSDMTALDEADTYYLQLTNAQGCVAFDTIRISRAAGVLQAFFIIPTDVVVNQEVVALEGSWPVPSSVNWFFPADSVELIRQEGDQFFFRFTEVGNVKLSLQSVLGSCEDWISKTITVHADSTTIPGLNPDAPDILGITLAPNPNGGNFSVAVLLSGPKDIALSIYDINGALQDRRLNTGADNYTESYNLSVQPGTYYLIVQSPRQRRTIAFTIVTP